jgi:hypothetical protein
MQCSRPIILEAGHRHVTVPCRKCMNCRVTNRRRKLLRLLLEAQDHAYTTFATLTYTDVPVSQQGHPTLVKAHLQKWLKRMRKQVPLRTFACGEYGGRFDRPHYHAILFGIPAELAEQLIQTTWADYRPRVEQLGPPAPGDQYLPGSVNQAVPANRATMEYVCGYVIDKLVGARENPCRAPEFGEGSRKPGLGLRQVPNLAKAFWTGAGAKYVDDHGDIPTVIQIGQRKYPMDNYLANLVREELGLPTRQWERVHSTPHVIDTSKLTMQHVELFEAKMSRKWRAKTEIKRAEKPF